jgi:hypothetical protein
LFYSFHANKRRKHCRQQHCEHPQRRKQESKQPGLAAFFGTSEFSWFVDLPPTRRCASNGDPHLPQRAVKVVMSIVMLPYI